MDTTRMHWLAAFAGLWMMSPAGLLAQDSNPASPPSAGDHVSPRLAGAAANCAMDLAMVTGVPLSPGMSEEDAPTVLESAPPTTEVAAPSTVANSEITAEEVNTPAAGTVEDAVVVPRSGSAAGEFEESESATAAIPKGKRAMTSPGHNVPWYRSPFVALAAVLALIAGAWSMFKRYVPAVRPVAPAALRVVGRTPISAKQSAVLLHVGKRLVLVGVTPDSMRTLAEFTDDEEVAYLMGKVSSAATPANGEFRTALAHEFNKYDDEVDSAPMETVSDDETMRETQGQLQGLLNKLRAMQTT